MLINKNLFFLLFYHVETNTIVKGIYFLLANWLRHKGVDDMANEIEVAFERLFKEEYEGKLAFAKDMDDKDGNYPLPRRL